MTRVLDLQPVRLSGPNEFPTQQELFQRTIKQGSSFLVIVLPADYNAPGGVYSFGTAEQASQFAAVLQDTDAACFMVYGHYVPLSVPLFMGSIGGDLNRIPQVELSTGRTLDHEEMVRLRALYHQIQNAPPAIEQEEPEVEGEETGEVSEPGDTSEPGESTPAESLEASPEVSPEVSIEAPAAETSSEAASDDDFADLPTG